MGSSVENITSNKRECFATRESVDDAKAVCSLPRARDTGERLRLLNATVDASRLAAVLLTVRLALRTFSPTN
jgi:hypothetical protein